MEIISFEGEEMQPTDADQGPVAALAGKIREDKVLPIVGVCFTNDLTFTSHDSLVSGWAKRASYPDAADKTNLSIARISQFARYNEAGGAMREVAAVKKSYLDFLKDALVVVASRKNGVTEQAIKEVKAQKKTLTVSAAADRFDLPSLSEPDANPLLLLASLPLSIYLTTSYHRQLEAAIKQTRGVEAATEICRWHPALHSIPSPFDSADYDPNQRPLVYHLHGCDDWPESLVLTVDDHLDFLAAISRDVSADQSQKPAVHPRIKDALTLRSLAMIGYRPNDWDFRVLFRGLIKPSIKEGIEVSRVAIQLERDESAKIYLQRYLTQAAFDVIEEDPTQFIHELFEKYAAEAN